jgi:hypothetical protein
MNHDRHPDGVSPAQFGDKEMIAMDQIRVLLVGGPPDLPDAECVREVPDLGEPVKVAWRGGYEHFRYAGESRKLQDSRLPVFAWCKRTRIAE